MKIGELRRSLFMHYDCKWNSLVREVTATLEKPEEEVSELETSKVLLAQLKRNAHLDRDFPERNRIAELFEESV
jgi:hypothetical protein